jgi:thymidylate synthase (FAD)
VNIQLLDHSTVELIKTNASDADVAFAAWVSNFADEARNRPTDRIEGLINFLYRENHTSPFEHGSFTFFVDTPIFVAREYMRHRTWSYNETSGRYMEMKPRFYLPNEERPLVQTGKVGSYKHSSGTFEQYDLMTSIQKRHFEDSWTRYQQQLQAGIAREVARNVLPLATMTQFYATANPLNVLKFFTLRSDDQALHEIRAVSAIEEEMFKAAMPLTYAAFDKKRDEWEKIQKVLQLVGNVDTLLAMVENGEFNNDAA